MQISACRLSRCVTGPSVTDVRPTSANTRRRFALVHYVCDLRPGHTGPGQTLTIYEGKWAYCPAVHAESHHWVPTGGVPFFELADTRRTKAGA